MAPNARSAHCLRCTLVRVLRTGTLMHCTAARLLQCGGGAAAATHQQSSPLTRRPAVLCRHKQKCLPFRVSNQRAKKAETWVGLSHRTGAIQAPNEAASIQQNVSPSHSGADFLLRPGGSQQTDMLQQKLQLSGGVTAVVAVLEYPFMAATGVLQTSIRP